MAEGSDSAGISGNSAESLRKEAAKRRDGEMAVDGGSSCAAKEAGDGAERDGKNDAVGCSPLEKAEAFKTEGNELFKQHQYAEAVSKYSAAIDTIDESSLDPKETQLHVYLCNRSFAHLRMENFGMILPSGILISFRMQVVLSTWLFGYCPFCFTGAHGPCTTKYKQALHRADFLLSAGVVQLFAFTGSAIIDAERALELNPKFSKGYYRRGTGYFCLGNLKAAQRGEYCHSTSLAQCFPHCCIICLRT